MRLFDDAQERVRIGNRDGIALRAATQIFEEQFDLLRQFVGIFDFIRHRARRVIRQDNAVISFSLQEHTFENVFAEVDADD